MRSTPQLTLRSRANRRINNNNNAAANRIRGPQSALTDFLASHNISAQQIHQDYQRRVQEAERQAQHNAQNNNDDKENEDEEDEDDIVERQKRKRKEEKALLKIKQSKEFKRRKHEQDDDFEQDDDELAKSMLAKSKPLPGQLDNCEVCGKRFTVTPYSGTGPDGGLLCTKCSKELKDEKKKEAKAAKKKVAAPRGRRRQTESDRMMGDVKPGAKSLLEICVRHVANVAHDIDEFGDMPQYLLDRLSQIFSKQRVFTPRVLELFLRPDVDRINVYDCGKLEKEDFQKIFAFMPNLESVNLRFAGQLKDDVIMYMADKCKKIRHLQLGATNLVSDNAWIELFRSLGPQLESLKLSELNDSLRDDTIKELVKNCPNLKRLKLRSCSYVTEESLESFCTLTQLEHLTLAIAQDTSADTLSKLVSTVGHNLRTLCLEEFSELDDTVLDAIKSSCTRLSKLRIRGSSLCTDGAFAGLFDNNCPFPPLVCADFADNRDIDSMNPDGPEDDPVGFGSLALTALMNHSGPRLKNLDLKSCRHITHAALLEAFDGLKRYPALTDIDLSFVTQVDEVVLVGIFKSCPSLAKLAVFACFNARQAVIPAGIAVIGLPNPQDNIVREGDVQMVMS
ncbi:UV-damaged DNA-binding protein rad7 [Knufia peltigerae]|uniref:UV-damaged DNA-binding protein rad7 n=1 Tax=Knufia peltigerae TaxID=1002370 RepID=A0AA38XUW3_9EURO|nr:UV-damaged DNA-binding protein rad7 [Knufia peltigerae]